MDIEKHVLLQLCRLIGGNSDFEPDLYANVKIDEEKLYQTCLYHQVLPFFYYFRDIFRKSFPSLSQDFFSKAKNYSIFNTTRLMVYENFLIEFDQQVSNAGIDYRLLKGIALAFEIYEEPYLRTFGDLDILILPDSLEIVNELLLQNGYFICEDLYSAFPTEIIKKYSFARHYIRKKPSILAVDVHLNLSGKLHPFQFDLMEFWNNSRDVEINESKFRTFNKEYTTVYLLYHAFKHYYFKLIWIIDVYEILSDDMDFDKLGKLIIKYNLVKMWNVFLNISRDLFGRIPGNADILDEKKYHSLKRHRIINKDSMLRGVLPYSPSIGRIILPLIYLHSFLQKVRYLLRQLFPPKDAIRDFYVNKSIMPDWSDYLKLRTKAILELIHHVK